MTTRTRSGVWLCPAPVAPGVRCGHGLPCITHAINEVGDGILRYGDAYGRLTVDPIPFEIETGVELVGRVPFRPDLAILHPSRRPRPRLRIRYARIARLALYALTAVLVVSSLGDDRFTGKTLAAGLAVVASTLILRARLDRR